MISQRRGAWLLVRWSSTSMVRKPCEAGEDLTVEGDCRWGFVVMGERGSGIVNITLSEETVKKEENIDINLTTYNPHFTTSSYFSAPHRNLFQKKESTVKSEIYITVL
jgi:hypothetical protein